MSISGIDHVALGLSRITTEYRGQPDFTAYITALMGAPSEIDVAGEAILASLDIDVAIGSQLDLIGNIVGIPRSVPEAQPAPFFGFTDTANSLPYGDAIFGGGGAFYDGSSPALVTLLLGDPTYRQFIRARIQRNKSTGTTEDFISCLRCIFPSDNILVNDQLGALRINIGLDRATTATENVFLTFKGILPKPSGVAIVNLPYQRLVNPFGFSPYGAPYGDAVTGGGGPFANDRY